ncbi:MAG: MgtC/SapB family protein [Thermomicrobiales bacterium]
MLEVSDLEITIRIVVALLLGAVIGLEREWESKPAGMRTFALVSEGAALFMIGGILLFNEVRDAGGATGDPNRVTSTIVQGIGFLAAGVIITASGRVQRSHDRRGDLGDGGDRHARWGGFHPAGGRGRRFDDDHAHDLSPYRRSFDGTGSASQTQVRRN